MAHRRTVPSGDQRLTLADFQQHIRHRYYKTDKARGTPGTFLWFIEEVGELATALHRSAGNGGPAVAAKKRGQNLADEFADVLAWLCTLANINDVDLAQAVKRKYLTGRGPKGHK
jgi:NTP pyrophosphatase (non-canonical NTP hydrolase)